MSLKSELIKESTGNKFGRQSREQAKANELLEAAAREAAFYGKFSIETYNIPVSNECVDKWANDNGLTIRKINVNHVDCRNVSWKPEPTDLSESDTRIMTRLGLTV